MINKEDKDFLKNYSIKNFERPSLTTDLVLFSLKNKTGFIPKKRSAVKSSLSILLVKRKNQPYKDCWALPGGFCKPDEDVYESALRVLRQETGIEHIDNLSLTEVFGEKDRDPRGWIISNSFRSLISEKESFLENIPLDRWETKWFFVSLIQEEESSIYTLKFESEDNSDSFEIPLKLTTKLFNYKFELLNEEINALAFDHTNIIAINILKLYQDASKDISLAFKLLNEEFTLYEFQNALEAITGRILSAPNFRRDTAHLVKKTAKTVISGCRPAYLYTKK